MSGRRRCVLLTLGALLLLGLAVAWSGLVSVAASSGHAPPVAWLLHWTLRNAVRTQSLGIAPPPGLDLQDPQLVRLGAGHFASQCATCHGAPDVAPEPVLQAMTPSPPDLARSASHWQDAQLFWIVKHGVKFTGMPAWPTALRDDEVWAMVAFLRALPGLSAERYRELVFGRHPHGSDGDAVSHACANCHGHDGMGQGRAVPIIAGQSQAYLYQSLRAFASGERHSGMMAAATAQLDDAQLHELATHYAAKARGASAGAVDTGLLELGRSIAEQGIPRLGVPACEACHGRAAKARNGHFPSLHGQRAAYLRTHLRLFRDARRGGAAYAAVMGMVASQLPDAAIDAVALHYAAQPADAAETPEVACRDGCSPLR